MVYALQKLFKVIGNQNKEKTIHMRIVKVLFVLVSIFIILSSCKQDIKVNSLEEVLLNISPNYSKYTLNPIQGKLLTAEKGTVIYIPKNAFQFEDGSLPKKEIQIEVKECYELADMIAENLSTTSKGKILETGGMIFLSAVSEGKPLKIQEGKALVLGFPKVKEDKEMDLFYDFKVNDTTSTWIPDYDIFQEENSQIRTEEKAVSEEYADEEKYPITITEDLYDYRLCITGYNFAFWYLKFKNQDKTIFDYMDEFSKPSDSLVRALYGEDWNLELEGEIELSGESKWKRKDYTNHYNIAKNGKWEKIKPLNSYYTHVSLRKRIIEYLNKTPEFDIKAYRDSFPLEPRQADITEYSQSLYIGTCREVNQELYKKKFREQYAQYTNSAVQKMNKDVLEHYMFSTTKLGWINCDRFWDLEDSKKTNLIVKVPNLKDTKVQLIFKEIKSILNGFQENGNIVFNDVPLNSQVKIIGISYRDGKPTMAIRETSIDSTIIELNEFKEFTLDQLKEQLNLQ